MSILNDAKLLQATFLSLCKNRKHIIKVSEPFTCYQLLSYEAKVQDTRTT